MHTTVPTLLASFRMAKDIIGLLNGLGKVASAFSCQIGAELSALSRKASLAPLPEADPSPGPTVTIEDTEPTDVSQESSLAKEFEELTRSHQKQTKTVR